MIDTHLHILPGVDDGPETMQESLTLAQMLVQEGIQDAHGLHRRPPGVIRGLERARELVGQVRVYQMIQAQPAAILSNQFVQSVLVMDS